MTSVWWPGINHEIQNMVQQCPTCAQNRSPRKQPLIPTPLPNYPWQKVVTDLFHLNGATYLLTVDYFSRYPEVQRLSTLSSQAVIEALKACFSRYGIPEVVVSDNGPQYSSQEFASFVKDYNITHVTSSPRFPQSNGQAERAVQTVKKLLKDTTDAQMALLVYRTTPLPFCSLSPAELLMGRRLRSNIPIRAEDLVPDWSFLPTFRSLNEKIKQRRSRDFVRHHGVREQSVIPEDTPVWITSGENPVPGQIVSHRQSTHDLTLWAHNTANYAGTNSTSM